MKKIMFVLASSLLILSACDSRQSQGAAPQISQSSANNMKTAQDFLAKNKTKSGIVTTRSGLQYQIVESGPSSGSKPQYSSIVRVNYEGKLLNGDVFDSSYARGQAAEFPVADLIPAWTEALQLMRPGDEWLIWVDPSLGYGPSGAGCDANGENCDIGQNELIIFRMRLESIVGAGANNSPDISAADAVDGGAQK
ncbi:MAG: FKBP-type peptidyl-prolyl cis-trans isomerase FklB [Hyphomonadaceae bacterium]|nr:MAG: FKBP-type peptidyl-prolyl cis-trans isomerase FklB [Hyphomonadaceae bacterium]KAF0184882.1 MAG: FKBP-type peptidyl-prolyl cis-trans isomerase FklB [Hyphomonadaceae bacterium]